MSGPVFARAPALYLKEQKNRKAKTKPPSTHKLDSAVMHNSNQGPAPDPATAALAYDVYRSLLQTHLAHSPLSTATEQKTRAKNDRA